MTNFKTNSDRYAIVTYNEPMQFLPLLQNTKHYAYIKHDKDKAPTHYHIIAVYNNVKSWSRVLKEFSALPQNTQLRNISYGYETYEYLTHNTKGSTEKYQYSKDDIVTDSPQYWEAQFLTETEFENKRLEAEKKKEEESIEYFLNDLLAPKINLRQMASKYGRDFIKNYKNYMDFRSTVMHEENTANYELAQALIDCGEQVFTPLNEDITILNDIYKKIKGDIFDMNIEAKIIGKTAIYSDKCKTEHCVYHATITQSNTEGFKGISFYGDSDLQLNDVVTVRPYKRHSDGQWIYLLNK